MDEFLIEVERYLRSGALDEMLMQALPYLTGIFVVSFLAVWFALIYAARRAIEDELSPNRDDQSHPE